MCLTPEKCLGGTAWPNIVPGDEYHEIPLLLWCNSTLGLLMHWWKGTRQQAGRSRITITAVLDLPVLDPRTLTCYSYDVHCLLVAGHNLDRALKRAPGRFRQHLSKETSRQLQLLRHVYEHWQEQRGSFRAAGPPKRRAGAQLTKEFL